MGCAKQRLKELGKVKDVEPAVPREVNIFFFCIFNIVKFDFSVYLFFLSVFFLLFPSTCGTHVCSLCFRMTDSNKRREHMDH